MPKPVCPNCGGGRVVASLAKNSHDNCLSCGYSDFVVAFYREGPSLFPDDRKEAAEHHKPADKVQTNGQFGEGKPVEPWLQSAVEDKPKRTGKPYWWEKD